MQTKDFAAPQQPSAPDSAGHARATPLYERLPHGPHQLDRGEVLLHQRRRIQGAMVRAVATDGYHATSVKRVIELAGVSRRSFYEQFANKEDCFLATFEQIAIGAISSSRRAYRDAEGGLEERMHAAFMQLAYTIEEDVEAASLAVLCSATAGRAGMLRLRSAIATGERLLSQAFAQTSHAAPIPAPIMRAIAGGVHGLLAGELAASAGRVEPEELAEGLTSWTMSYAEPSGVDLGERLALRVRERARASSNRWTAQGSACAARTGGPVAAGDAAASRGSDVRERLLESALRLGVVGDFVEVTAPQIADGAGLPIECFHELFGDPGDCYGAALGLLDQRVLAAAASAERSVEAWPLAVPRAIGAVLDLLAAEPLLAHTLAAGAFGAGPAAARRSLDLAEALAAVITDRAPAVPSKGLLASGVAGATWHTIAFMTAGGRTQLLPMLTDHLAFAVLAPFLGARQAAAVASGEALAIGVCG